MKKKKININGYGLSVYDTKKYTSLHLKFLFEMPYTKETIFKYDLLEEYMIHSCLKYKTRKEINDRKMELYSLGYGLTNYNIGDKLFVEASFHFYDPKLISDDYLYDALVFAHDILFFPNFEKGHLDQEELSRSKDDLINYVDENLMNFRTRAKNDFIEKLYKGTYVTEDLVHSKEEYASILDSYSDEDLIDAHKNLLDNCLVGAIFFGNVDEKYLEYIEELFKFKSVQALDDNFNDYIPINKDIEDYYHVQDEDYSESVVRVAYNYKAKSLKEKMAYNAIVRMLGSSGMIIHKTLRDEMGIVYTAGAMYSKRLNYLTLIAFIDSKNVDKALEGFDIVLKKLDHETIAQLLNKIKEEIEESEYTFDESKWNVFDEAFNETFKLDTMKRRNKALKSLTVEDIEVALRKLKKVTVHFYEGVKK